jgi:hypothetical protein
MEALRRIHAYAPAFDAYWDNEVSTVLMAGRRPPVVAGFGTYLTSRTIERASNDFLARQLEEKTDRYDSHPSLSERLAALESFPPGDQDGSTPATALLRDPEGLETELLVTLFGPEAGELSALTWDDVGREVYLERARALCAEHGDLLGDATVGSLGALAADRGRIAGQLQQREPELPAEAAPDLAGTLLAEALLVALERAGWSVDATLGEAVLACRSEEQVDPYGVVGELLRGELGADAWRERATALGIADLRLHAPTPEPATA